MAKRRRAFFQLHACPLLAVRCWRGVSFSLVRFPQTASPVPSAPRSRRPLLLLALRLGLHNSLALSLPCTSCACVRVASPSKNRATTPPRGAFSVSSALSGCFPLPLSPVIPRPASCSSHAVPALSTAAPHSIPPSPCHVAVRAPRPAAVPFRRDIPLPSLLSSSLFRRFLGHFVVPLRSARRAPLSAFLLARCLSQTPAAAPALIGHPQQPRPPR